MDEVDIANARLALEVEFTLAELRSKNKPRPPSSRCLNGCGEPSAEGSNFCSTECCEDYVRRQEILQRQGRR